MTTFQYLYQRLYFIFGIASICFLMVNSTFATTEKITIEVIDKKTQTTRASYRRGRYSPSRTSYYVDALVVGKNNKETHSCPKRF